MYKFQLLTQTEKWPHLLECMLSSSAEYESVIDSFSSSAPSSGDSVCSALVGDTLVCTGSFCVPDKELSDCERLIEGPLVDGEEF